MAVLLHSVPAIRAMVAAGVLMVLTILGSYILYVKEGHTPVFLPTISGTWDYTPANYFSRWVVSITCIILELTAFVTYWATEGKFKHRRVLLGMALLGLLCFSVVGAACSSTKLPSCRGAGHVHSVVAVTFFVLYDLYLIFSIKQLYSSSVPALALVCIALTTKLRWLPDGYLGSFPAVPVFEYFDVGSIVIAQLVLSLKLAPSYCIGVAQLDTEDSKPNSAVTVLTSFTANKITAAVVSLMLVCTTITYPFAVHQGIIKPHFPFVISDTWWHSPGDMIARWGISLSCHLLQVLLLMMDHMGNHASQRWLWTAQLGAFCLSLVAVISEVEQPILHTVLACTWGVGIGAYMIASCCSLGNASVLHVLQRLLAAVALASSVLLLVVKLPVISEALGVGKLHGDSCEQMIGAKVCTFVAYYEWTTHICVYAFLLATFVFDKEGRGRSLALVVARREKTEDRPIAMDDFSKDFLKQDPLPGKPIEADLGGISQC